MANFAVDPTRFALAGMQVLEPWGADERPARMYVTASVTPPRRHESWAIAEVIPRPVGDEVDQVLEQVAQHIVEELQFEVISFAESAVGLGLFRMVDSVIRDLLVNTPEIPFGNGRTLRFVKHDEGSNFRATSYTSLGWLMMLNLPMDYRNEEFLRESVGKFGKMRGWFREDPSPSRTMVRCHYGGARDVPRSIVIREPQRYGGTVVSWTVPVFIMLTNQADVLPGDESPEPHNGNPHPPFGGPGGFDGNAHEDDDWLPDNVAPNLPSWGNWNDEGADDNARQGGWDAPHDHPSNPGQMPRQDQSTVSFEFSRASTSSVHYPIPEEDGHNVQIFRVLMPDPVVLWDDFLKRKLPSLLFSEIDKPLDRFGALPLSLCEISALAADLSKEDYPDVMPKKKKARKTKEKVVLLVDTEARRSTRSHTKTRGYKLTPMLEKEPRKKPRSTKPRMKKSDVAPDTLIKVLQQAEEFIEIPGAELAVEKLMATPKDDSSSESSK
ncbi:hypothetical protein ACQ4PT_008858 [Festuca glaucescens]